MLCDSSLQRIGIVGGTFNPPHLGHLAIAKAALASSLIDIVWFLPCWQHAFGKDPSAFHHRASMCFLMVKDEPNIYVCTAEFEIKSKYSIKILEHIKKTNTDKVFRLILGTDNYWKMDKWKEKDKIIRLAPPIWVRRPKIKEIPESTIECDFNISSSEIRELIKNPRINNNWQYIHDKVLDYIKVNNLYRSA